MPINYLSASSVSHGQSSFYRRPVHLSRGNSGGRIRPHADRREIPEPLKGGGKTGSRAELKKVLFGRWLEARWDDGEQLACQCRRHKRSGLDP